MKKHWQAPRASSATGAARSAARRGRSYQTRRGPAPARRQMAPTGRGGAAHSPDRMQGPGEIRGPAMVLGQAGPARPD